jgi:PAS domain S-box-containing protein
MNTKDPTAGSIAAAADLPIRVLPIEDSYAAEAETRRLLDDAERSRRTLLSVVEDQKRTAVALERRLVVERAAADCIRLLVEPRDPELLLPELLAILCKAEEASRVYVFRNVNTSSGLCTAVICEASADGIPPQLDNPMLQHLPYEAMPSLLPVLLARQPFARVQDEVTDQERAMLVNLGVQSVLILPIFSGPLFWGFIGFADSVSARCWNENDVRLLQLVADGIGVSVHRQEARTELELKSRALEAAANAIVITDRKGAIEWANSAFTSFTGYALDESQGRNPGALLKSGRHDAAFYRALWDTILADQVWCGEIINRRKDGSLYTEEMTITPVKNQQGDIAHFIAVKQDITRRKLLEEQLRQSQKMDAVGRLAGGVAHDFNNMLAVILMNASLLRLPDASGQGSEEQVRQIVMAAERAANLTRQLLLFSRRQVMQQRTVELGEVVTGMVKMLQRIIGEDIILQTRFAPGGLLVHGDPGMLEQVLLNLAVNARDAMPGGGEIAIELERVDLDLTSALHPKSQPGAYIRLSVRDTGCGIAPEHLSQVFEPFFTTKEIGKGTGLGLATVHGILEQHHGWIEVESRLGQGTTFFLYLPRLNDETVRSYRQNSAPKVRGGKETILLVEDEMVLRLLTARSLEGCGYRVLTAPTGAAALNLWSEQAGRVDLLLTDVVMPEGVSGGQLAEQLRAQQPSLKVLFMSGYPGDVAGRGLDLREGKNFLQKPFISAQLAQAVRDCLDAEPPMP